MTKIKFYTILVEWKLTKTITQKIIQETKLMFCVSEHVQIVPITLVWNDSLTHILSYAHGMWVTEGRDKVIWREFSLSKDKRFSQEVS